MTNQTSSTDTKQSSRSEVIKYLENQGDIVTVKSIFGRIEKLYKGEITQGISTGFMNLDGIFKIFKKQLTTVSGVPSHGKSEFMDAIIMNTAMEEHWRWGIFSPENFPHEVHFQKLCEKLTNFPFAKTPLSTLGTAMQFIDEHMIWANPKEPTVDSLKSIFKTLVMTHGVDAILLDPYNEIEHKRPSNMSENEYISWFLTDMRRFARMYDIALFIVAHPTKLNADRTQDRTKPILMNSYDINGSAAWANKSDNIMIAYRPDFNKHEVQIHMQKVKFKWTGQRGFVTLKYAYETGRYFV